MIFYLSFIWQGVPSSSCPFSYPPLYAYEVPPSLCIQTQRMDSNKFFNAFCEHSVMDNNTFLLFIRSYLLSKYNLNHLMSPNMYIPVHIRTYPSSASGTNTTGLFLSELSRKIDIFTHKRLF